MSAAAEPARLFTIGHSNHELAAFAALLKKHGVTAIADVRSAPYSKYTPQFNRDVLQTALAARGIEYFFLGRELGARRSERECYDSGVARYERVAATPAFSSGLERVRAELKTRRMALLCAEKDPLTCHRMILVTRRMRSVALQIGHIREDGTLESNDQAEERLLRMFHPDGVDLFRSRAELVEDAYDQQAGQIAYRETDAAEAGRRMSGAAIQLFTIGFTRRTAEDFFTTLRDADVRRVIDVRLNNTSQLAGFSKRDDLDYFLRNLAEIEYTHLPELAPTQEMLDAYKKQKGDWLAYEEAFLALMKERKIEKTVPKQLLDGGCLLCSEEKPHHCHRRLVAEYLNERLGEIEVRHL